tara:strand:+ start:872 stop:1198 length:327 start_codon:yes stop_codon:yes gene_type:complete
MKKKITKNFIKKYWETIEKKKPPKNVKNIKIIESKNFFNAIDNYSDNSLHIKKIISNIYSGDALIIKNAISKKETDKIRKKFRARWWCGLYSPESDLKKNRQTSSPSK